MALDTQHSIFDPHSLISAHLGGGCACGRRRGIARALLLEAETRAGIVPTSALDVHGAPECTIFMFKELADA